MSRDDSGPAFPVHGLTGMTLRDYFAAMAMQGVLACSREYVGVDQKNPWPDRARIAYTAADAMLKAREA